LGDLISEYLEQVWTQHFVGHNDVLDIVFCNNNYYTNTDGSLTSVDLTLILIHPISGVMVSLLDLTLYEKFI
jgi:hypothetical protein